MNVLLIDNRDSFTFNLAESCGRLGAKVDVVRNCIDPAQALERALAKEATIILSPGPGEPEAAGCCLELVEIAKTRTGVLGICLGHQVIVKEAGGRIDRAEVTVHGKSSVMTHTGEGPFAGLPNPLRVGRYHSLCTNDLPDGFTVHARLDGMAMAISNSAARQIGLQFHPESILTPNGDAILGQSLAWLRGTRA